MITRLFQAFQRTLGIGKERYFVGHDLVGNSYYEKLPVKGAESTRPKRFVNFKHHRNDPALYRQHHLLPQWSSWLSFTRHDPPSIEELQADQLRLARLQENIKRLALQDQMNKQALLANEEGTEEGTANVHDSVPDLRESVFAGDHEAEIERKRRKMNESPLSAFTLQSQTNPDQNWQPQSWNPKPSKK